MKFHFTNVSDNIATMLIYKHIGFDKDLGYGVDGNEFANEINWLNENVPTLTNIDVRINSVGGSVHEGFSIVSAILNSKIPVDTYIDGMAYSMAGVIAMCGKKRSIADYGTFMMHNAQGGGDEEVLNLITTSLATVFEQTTGLTLDKCKELMAKETWLNAKECLSLGLVDEVIKTKKEIPTTTNVFELHEIYNSYINNQTKIKMLKLTNIFNLSAEASEDAIVAEVEKLNEKNASVEAENETLKAELATAKEALKKFEDAEKEKEAKEVEAVINAAITEGKIKEESREKWLNRGLDASNLKDIFSEIKTVPVHTPITNVINADALVNGAEDRTNWSYKDWSKNDPKGLENLMVNNKPAFDELVNKLPQTIISKR